MIEEIQTRSDYLTGNPSGTSIRPEKKVEKRLENIFYLSRIFYIWDLNQLNKNQMANLKFTDGEVFNTSGELRKEKRSDGWYVMGMGMLIPVRDEAEADKIINKLK